MKKIQMLVNCKAYSDVHKITDFEKGKKYEVNDFLFNTFTKSKRAVTVEESQEIIEDPIGDIIEDEDVKIETEDEGNPEDETEESQEIEEGEKESPEFIDLESMSKEELKNYAKELEISFKGNPSSETMINKIKEVQNASIE